jgi:hypothetical protein
VGSPFEAHTTRYQLGVDSKLKEPSHSLSQTLSGNHLRRYLGTISDSIWEESQTVPRLNPDSTLGSDDDVLTPSSDHYYPYSPSTDPSFTPTHPSRRPILHADPSFTPTHPSRQSIVHVDTHWLQRVNVQRTSYQISTLDHQSTCAGSAKSDSHG